MRERRAIDLTGQTIQQVIRTLREAFVAASVGEDAGGDARRLIAAALGTNPVDLITDPARIPAPHESARLGAFAARRIAREPVTRILGEREFYGRPFMVTPAVLDPRADTETLITACLELARVYGWNQRPITILDIGTGSGAIICTLLAEFPQACGVAIDVSGDALAVARANAQSLGVGGRLTFERRDIFAGFPAAPAAGFDLVVSNPPYIASACIASLDPEVAIYDPRLALDGGGDGLDFYRAILESWAAPPNLPAKQRALVLELGAGQAEDVVRIAAHSGALAAGTRVQKFRDLGGHERCVAVGSQPQS